MLQLMDCTLRDGANVVGKGFNAEITDLVLKGLTEAKVPIIEIGNAGGIGAYEVAGFTDALTDEEYLQIASKYLNSGSEIGMFLNATRFREKYVDLAKEAGLHFLRVGADAGNVAITIEPVKAIKARGLKAYYSFMKAYVLTPAELAEEAKQLVEAGIDELTIMDSAGTMLPHEVAEYVKALTAVTNVPIGFHGHNNLGLSAANALAAYESGATILDCGLMGMARSAGNLSTENCIAMMQRVGKFQELDLFGLLNFINDELEPAMKKFDYHNPLSPLDLTLGFSGCHSSFVKTFKEVAKEKNVNLYELICKVSELNKDKPSKELMLEIADKL